MNEKDEIRTQPSGPYTVIGNHAFNDEDLSADGLAVWCYVRSRPPGWTVYPLQLAKRFAWGKGKIYAVLTDLIERGYVRRIEYRDGGRYAKFRYVFVDRIFHEPFPENRETVADPPFPGLPDTAKRDAANRDALINTDDSPSKDSKEVLTLSGGPPAKLSRAAASAFFDERFWPRFPKRTGGNPKEDARQKFIAAVVSGENPEEILAGAARLEQEMRAINKLGTEIVPMCVTWLNKKRWKDDPGPAPVSQSPPRRGGDQPGFFELASQLRTRNRDEEPDQ